MLLLTSSLLLSQVERLNLSFFKRNLSGTARQFFFSQLVLRQYPGDAAGADIVTFTLKPVGQLVDVKFRFGKLKSNDAVFQLLVDLMGLAGARFFFL